MYVKQEFYGIKCDGCGLQFEDNEHNFFGTEGSVLEYATDSEWLELESDKHYCPDCHCVDDNDNVIIKVKEETK